MTARSTAPASTTTAREVHLVRRPHGLPDPEDFALVDRELGAPGDGQVLVRNHYLSVDPYMRGRMNDVKSYVPPFALNEPMDGRAVGEVVASGSDDGSGPGVGELVLSDLGWRTHGITETRAVRRVPAVDGVSASAYLGVLGAPGLTAWLGLLDKASFRPGDAVFVSGAAGAVGSLVGQLARLRGASRVVGSAGSAAKVAWLTDELGFDAAFDYKHGSVTDQLRAAAPDGIDVYFDNVGGDHLEAAMEVANDHARVAACGAVSTYNATEPPPGPHNMFQIVKKRLSIRGFIVTDDLDRFPAFLDEVTPWVASGEVRFAETVVEGVDHAVEAFRGMLRGENTGKMLVKVGPAAT